VGKAAPVAGSAVALVTAEVALAVALADSLVVALVTAEAALAADSPVARVNTQLLQYLEQHQGATTYLFAVNNSNSAAPYIILTGRPVMSLGGFSGSDPILTVAQFEALVKNNTVRYVLGGGGRGFGGFGGFGGGAATVNGDSVGAGAIQQWVEQACTLVPSTAYSSAQIGSGSQGGSGGGFGGGFGGGQQLYDCAGAVK
jgi:4-amino-4-deoxy-L-arabinose transferase-like glycosyltransferase